MKWQVVEIITKGERIREIVIARQLPRDQAKAMANAFRRTEERYRMIWPELDSSKAAA